LQPSLLAAIFGDVRVGVGNILRDDNELPDGSRQHGMTAQLFVAKQEVTVGKGTRITLGAERGKSPGSPRASSAAGL